jgi:outer membrane murein-binding lipoprotein Lpp
MKTHKKINTKLLSILLTLLMITPALFTALSTIPVPVYASTGHPKLAAVDDIASPSSITPALTSINVTAGTATVTAVDTTSLSPPGYFAIVFYDSTTGWYVIFSGAQFKLYISKDGFSSLSSDDIVYGPIFSVAELSQDYHQVGTTNYYAGKISVGGTDYYVVVGPIPVSISQDYQYIKIFDGTTTAVAVGQQVVYVQPGITVTPTSGAAGRKVTIQGGGFPVNQLVNINYTYTYNNWAGNPVTVRGVLASNIVTGPGYFSITATMIDTKAPANPGGTDPTVTQSSVDITLFAVNASKPSQDYPTAQTTFTEKTRVFQQLVSYTGTTLHHDLVSPTGTITPPAGNDTDSLTLDVYIGDTVRVAGKWFYANSVVDLYVSNIHLGTFSTDINGFFNDTFTVPILSMGSQTVKVISNNVVYVFYLNVLPTLLLVPSQGTVGSSVKAFAYGFPPDISVYIYWFEKALGDGRYYNVANGTTGSNGQFNVTVTFKVPHAYGGSHDVYAYDTFSGSSTDSPAGTVIASTSFKVLPAFTIVPSAFSSNGTLVSVIGTGLDPTVSYDFTIDHSLLYGVNSNDTGDFKFTFVAAGFRPGLHVVELYSGAISPGYYAPVASVTFFVTTDGDVIAGQFASILAQLSNVSAQLSNMNAVLTQVAGDVAVIKTDSGYVRVKVDDLMALLSGVNATVSTVAGDVSGVKSDVAVIRSNVGTIMTSVNNLAFLLNAVGARIVSIQNDTATLKTNVGTIMATLPALNASITAVGNNVVAIKTSVGTLQGTVTDVKNGVATISTDVGTIKADVSTIKGNVSALQSGVKAAQDAASAANSNAASASSTAQTTMWLVVLTFIISLVSLVFIFRRK